MTDEGDRAGCGLTSPQPADGVDNDCDGRVDEEKQNGRDDDGDGKVDEDVGQDEFTIGLLSFDLCLTVYLFYCLFICLSVCLTVWLTD